MGVLGLSFNKAVLYWAEERLGLYVLAEQGCAVLRQFRFTTIRTVMTTNLVFQNFSCIYMPES